eukprot:Amastigsp_a843513_25.p3 type:complete len:121 gc:universal Amastigsp_a843513_25:82-444(+)
MMSAEKPRTHCHSERVSGTVRSSEPPNSVKQIWTTKMSGMMMAKPTFDEMLSSRLRRVVRTLNAFVAHMQRNTQKNAVRNTEPPWCAISWCDSDDAGSSLCGVPSATCGNECSRSKTPWK